jgi:hypothetical protein
MDRFRAIAINLFLFYSEKGMFTWCEKKEWEKRRIGEGKKRKCECESGSEEKERTKVAARFIYVI